MKEKAAENSEEFLELIKKWQKLEDRTIASADTMLDAAKNPFLKMIMESIKHDSEKHKLIMQMIIDNITKEAVSISPEELNDMSGMLNNHMEAEAESLCLADAAYANSELFFTRFLLSYLIADESKHHGLISQLNDLKRATIATSTGARTHGYVDRPASDIERTSVRAGKT